MIELEQFAMAGKAVFTLVSKRTGARFTFKVRKYEDKPVAFVSLLSGPDNTADYQYLGCISAEGLRYFHGKKSRIGTDAPSAKAFAWTWAHRADPEAASVEVHHEGRCCRCGRALTVPESIESGVGPECRQKMGF
jgi:hypothetical protein